MIAQIRIRHPARKQHLVQLFTEASAIANDINVSSWGHHYCYFNKMTDRLAYIAMDTEVSVQAHATSYPGLVQEATTFLDPNVNHWLETSQAEQH